jgi:hypothetical protein
MRINYNTGTGDIQLDDNIDIDDAKVIADKGICYTQQDVTITDDDNNLITRRKWIGCTDGMGDECDPIGFGNLGYYTDWQD